MAGDHQSTDGLSEDLSDAAVFNALGGRPTRTYPAVVSTEVDARGWARAGAPSGAVVVADYQLAPRGRDGRVWEVRPGEGLGFSLIVRPDLPSHREGWPFVPATLALAELAGSDASIGWPDEVRLDGDRWAAVNVETELGPTGVAATIISVHLPTVEHPRTPMLADAVELVEAHLAEPAEDVIEVFTDRCETIGRSVTARLVPMGPAGRTVSGLAVDVNDDGAIVLRDREGRRAAVPPQALGLLEEAL